MELKKHCAKEKKAANTVIKFCFLYGNMGGKYSFLSKTFLSLNKLYQETFDHITIWKDASIYID